MVKKIIAMVLLVLVLGGGTYFYFHPKKEEAPVNIAIKAVPIDASFILESRRTLPLWKTIYQTSDIWKEFLDIPSFFDLDRQCKTLDSIISEHPELGTILENEPLFVSAHINGMNHFNYLFVGSVSGENSQSILSTFLDSYKGNIPANNLQYEETVIHGIKIDDKNTFYYTISNGIFISSFGPALIKESLRQLESGISLMNNAYFTKVLNACSPQVAASAFVNFQTCSNVSSRLFNRNFS